MIPEPTRQTIVRLAEKYGISQIILFGSAARGEVEPRDIDIGVRGLAPELFFQFYGELMRLLDTPVDVVDLDQENLFNQLVEESGVVIYG